MTTLSPFCFLLFALYFLRFVAATSFLITVGAHPGAEGYRGRFDFHISGTARSTSSGQFFPPHKSRLCPRPCPRPRPRLPASGSFRLRSRSGSSPTLFRLDLRHRIRNAENLVDGFPSPITIETFIFNINPSSLHSFTPPFDW